mmetsp:Transcript_42944/g.121386  ORF Transcript_42944/g.121386 Transcript_42944/m.121386 type:complete len:235 (-) Transcript_42944:117-821(-)
MMSSSPRRRTIAWSTGRRPSPSCARWSLWGPNARSRSSSGSATAKRTCLIRACWTICWRLAMCPRARPRRWRRALLRFATSTAWTCPNSEARSAATNRTGTCCRSSSGAAFWTTSPTPRRPTETSIRRGIRFRSGWAGTPRRTTARRESSPTRRRFCQTSACACTARIRTLSSMPTAASSSSSSSSSSGLCWARGKPGSAWRRPSTEVCCQRGGRTTHLEFSRRSPSTAYWVWK